MLITAAIAIVVLVGQAHHHCCTLVWVRRLQLQPASICAPPPVHLQPCVEAWWCCQLLGSWLWLFHGQSGQLGCWAGVMSLATWHWEFKSAKIEKKKPKKCTFTGRKLCVSAGMACNPVWIKEVSKTWKGERGRKKTQLGVQNWVCDGNN